MQEDCGVHTMAEDTSHAPAFNQYTRHLVGFGLKSGIGVQLGSAVILN